MAKVPKAFAYILNLFYHALVFVEISSLLGAAPHRGVWVCVCLCVCVARSTGLPQERTEAGQGASRDWRGLASPLAQGYSRWRALARTAPSPIRRRVCIVAHASYSRLQ